MIVYVDINLGCLGVSWVTETPNIFTYKAQIGDGVTKFLLSLKIVEPSTQSSILGHFKTPLPMHFYIPQLWQIA